MTSATAVVLKYIMIMIILLFTLSTQCDHLEVGKILDVYKINQKLYLFKWEIGTYCNNRKIENQVHKKKKITHYKDPYPFMPS